MIFKSSLLKIVSINYNKLSFIYPSDIKAIGKVLYTKYIILFQLSALILLVAMIGAIVLTLRYKKKQNIKYQNINKQMLRNKKNSIKLCKVKNYEGLKIYK